MNIIAENITIVDEEAVLVKDVSFKVNFGQLILLLGSYSSGGEQLIKCLGGILEPDEGKVLIDDIDIYSGNTLDEMIEKSLKTSFVFKNGGLIANLSIKQNLMLPMNIYYKEFSNKYKEMMINEFMEEYGLNHLLNKRPHEVNQDYRKLIGFLRAHIVDAPIILMNEPTANLSLENGETVLNKIKRNKKMGLTQIIMNHSSENFLNLADGVIVMQNGSIKLKSFGEELNELNPEILDNLAREKSEQT